MEKDASNFKAWMPDRKGVKAAMKAWCNFAGTSDIEPCKHCVEADFVMMLEAYLKATGALTSHE
jgi:hypothetical protein